MGMFACTMPANFLFKNPLIHVSFTRSPSVLIHTNLTFVNFVDITPSLLHNDLWVKANMSFKVTIINSFS